MWALWPRSTPGSPGTVTPVTDSPGADRAAWYQIEGTVCGRCGSPASIDAAPATAGPFAAQALLSGYWWIRPGGSAPACARIAGAAGGNCGVTAAPPGAAGGGRPAAGARGGAAGRCAV